VSLHIHFIPKVASSQEQKKAKKKLLRKLDFLEDEPEETEELQ
jgi:hypothetical protein|tara:strand:- start:528 stop:656 length:129 start_codon:yes stop_codon:yes gene_type:complete